VLELLGHALAVGDDLVEGIGDPGRDASRVRRHAHGEVAHAHRLQDPKQLLQIGPVHRAVGDRCRRRA